MFDNLANNMDKSSSGINKSIKNAEKTLKDFQKFSNVYLDEMSFKLRAGFDALPDEVTKTIKKGLTDYLKTQVQLRKAFDADNMEQIQIQQESLRKFLNTSVESYVTSLSKQAEAHSKLLQKKIEDSWLLSPIKRFKEELTKGFSSMLTGKNGKGGILSIFGKGKEGGLRDIMTTAAKIPGDIVKAQQEERKLLISGNTPETQEKFKREVLSSMQVPEGQIDDFLRLVNLTPDQMKQLPEVMQRQQKARLEQETADSDTIRGELLERGFTPQLLNKRVMPLFEKTGINSPKDFDNFEARYSKLLEEGLSKSRALEQAAIGVAENKMPNLMTNLISAVQEIYGVTGKIADDTKDNKYGGLVCKAEGIIDSDTIRVDLHDSLMELYNHSYKSKGYHLKYVETIVDSMKVTSGFGTVIISICFVNYIYPSFKKEIE